MKKLILLSLMATSAFCAPVATNVPVIIQFTYDTNKMALTNTTFKVYSQTNLVALSNFVVVATFKPGTNTPIVLVTNGVNVKSIWNMTNVIFPGERYYYVTASNFWGETGPSNVALTPPIPSDIDDTSISRGW